MLQQHLTLGLFLFCDLFLKGLTSVFDGPSMLKASLGETLYIKCRYDKYYHNYQKYWCKGSDWNYCETVVKTDSTEKEKRVGRTVIKDNQTQFEFTVKMENITKDDADIYWCAIDKSYKDFKWKVNIMVTIELPPTGIITTEYFSTTSAFPTETTGRSPNSPPHTFVTPHTMAKNMTELNIREPDLIILLPVALGLLVLILGGTTLLMCKLKKRKAAKNSKGLLPSKVSPSSDQATDGTEVAYTTVIPTLSFASKSQASENTGKVEYASLRFSTLNDQPIYANM